MVIERIIDEDLLLSHHAESFVCSRLMNVCMSCQSVVVSKFNEIFFETKLSIKSCVEKNSMKNAGCVRKNENTNCLL